MSLLLRERFEALDEISRVRALSEAESRELEILLRQFERVGRAPDEGRAWTSAEDRALSFVDRRRRGWAKVMAPVFGRSEAALYARVRLIERS